MGASSIKKLDPTLVSLERKIEEINLITLSESFRNKTGYLVYFSINNYTFQKLYTIITRGSILIKAELVIFLFRRIELIKILLNIRKL